MVERSYNPEVLIEALAPHEEMVGKDFDVEDWVEDTNNVLLEEDGSCGLFEFEYPGVFSGHYFFKVRGKEAYNLSSRMLHEMFVNQGARVIKGLTPVDKRGALWLTRKLGFESYGIIDTWNGPCELFYMSIDQYFSNKDTQL